MVSTLGYRLIRTAGTVHQRYARTLATCELSPLQHATLAWIDSAGPIHQKALATAVGVDPGDLVKHLDSLQDRDLIQRERDTSDRRRQLVSITAVGADLLHRANTCLDEDERDCFADLAPEARDVLASELDSIHLRAGAHSDQPAGDFDVVAGRSALRAGRETNARP